jgi:ubiquinone/menaquinone biosynthesis C-methylase UbiE
MAQGFDRLAGFYDGMMHFMLGGVVKDSQRCFLDKLPPQPSIFIIGGGTGWILKEIWNIRPKALITYLEISPKMLAQTQKNIPKDKISQITLCLGDESQIPFSKSFDAVCSFFFIDLFPSPKAETITQRFLNCLKPSGILLYADFEAEGKNRKWRKHLIRLMYLVCGLFCKLENKFYWNYTSVLTKNHFCLKDSKVFFYGLVRASLYVIEL